MAQGDEWRHPVARAWRAATDRFIMVDMMRWFWASTLRFDSVDSIFLTNEETICVGFIPRPRKNAYLEWYPPRHVRVIRSTANIDLNANKRWRIFYIIYTASHIEWRYRNVRTDCLYKVQIESSLTLRSFYTLIFFPRFRHQALDHGSCPPALWL